MTIASRALRIFGSGTRSTRTSLVPCQTSAFMMSSTWRRIGCHRFSRSSEWIACRAAGPSVVGISPVSMQLLEAAQVLAGWSGPARGRAARRPPRRLLPPGGSYCRRTCTSVPRSGPAGVNRTEPALITSAPSSVRQPISSSGISLMISASHSTVRPAGRLGDPVRAALVELSDRHEVSMNRGRFSKLRQKRKSSSAGRLMVTRFRRARRASRQGRPACRWSRPC